MYQETFSNLNAPILFSHIHFGFPREATGIMVFLCGRQPALLEARPLARQTRRRAPARLRAQCPAA
jgi:hypothetical protein